MKKISLLLCVSFILFSCKKDVKLDFEEQNIEQTTNAIVEISYPKAQGTKNVAESINSTLENFIANEISMSEDVVKNVTLNEAIKGFDNEFKTFKKDFENVTQQWKASVNAEVIYESSKIICFSINTYLDTGGAHGNSHVTFLNFDAQTGKLLKQNDLIKNPEDFKKIAEEYFLKEAEPINNGDNLEDYFFGEGFKLPENMGFNENGIILLYNVYEIASYVQGVTEFTIPYAEANPYLKIEQ